MNGSVRYQVAVSAACAALACAAPKDDGFDELWITDHVAYYARSSDQSVCEGVAATAESYLLSLAARLGVEQRAIKRLTYYKYDNEDEVRSAENCGPNATGCANSEAVWDVRPVNGHELVHWLLANQFGGTSPQLLEEGLATALSCEPYSDSFDTITPDWASLASSSFPLEQYVVAGRVVTAMIHELGIDEVTRLYRDLPDADDLAALDIFVREQTGMTLEQLYAHALEENWPVCLPVYACSGADLDEGRTRLTLGCHGYDPAILPKKPGAFARLSATSSMILRRCDLNAEPTPDRYRLMGSSAALVGELLMELPESTMALTFSHSEDIEARAREANLTMSYASNAVNDGCSNLTPITSFVNSGIGILLSPTAEFRTVAFAQEVPRTLRVDYATAAANVQWCRTCSDDTLSDCEEIAPLSSQTITATGTGYLRIRRVGGVAGYMTVTVSEPAQPSSNSD